jgi:pimeloyl-ACP methyl ester carboxylesterase
VTIDSVIPTDRGQGAPNVVESFERVKRVFFDGCAKDQQCHAAFPNLEADFNTVVSTLNATPYRNTVQDSALGRTTPITITGADLTAGLFLALYQTDLIPQLPGLIEQLKAGTGGPIIDQLAVQAFDFLNGLAELDAAAVLCSDDATVAQQGNLDELLGQHPNDPTLLLTFAVPCNEFGVRPAPAGFNDPVRSDLPTLVLGDEYDPVTPPEQSKHASETLSHSTFVEFPGLGHGAVFAQPECPEIIFRAFLADPAAAVSTSCVASMRPPKWAVPG